MLNKRSQTHLCFDVGWGKGGSTRGLLRRGGVLRGETMTRNAREAALVGLALALAAGTPAAAQDLQQKLAP